MSSTIHMQTESVQDLCDAIKRSAEDMYDLATQMNVSIQRIDWEGPGQLEFYERATRIIADLKLQADNLDSLGQAGWKEVEQWIWIDQQGVSRFKGGSSTAQLTPFLRGYGDVTAVHPNDLRQGQVGDCFLLAPLAAIATRDPSFIQNMIKDNGDGTYTVTFYDHGKAVEIVVSQADLTAELGLSKDGEWMVRAGFGDSSRNQRESWVQIVESGYAKWKGGFPNINEGGYPTITLAELTGNPPITRVPVLSSFDDLAMNFNKGYPITATSLPSINIESKQIYLGITTITTPRIDIAPLNWASSHYQGDLVNNHVYYLTGVDGINQTVTIRNPWGWSETNLTIPYTEFQSSFGSFEASPI